MTNTLQGMYNQRKISSRVKIGSGEHIEANIIGDVSGIAVQKDGTKKDITLRNEKICTMFLLQINQPNYDDE